MRGHDAVDTMQEHHTRDSTKDETQDQNAQGHNTRDTVQRESTTHGCTAQTRRAQLRRGMQCRRCDVNTVPPARHGPRLQHPPGSHRGAWPEPFGRRSPAWRRRSARSPGRHRSLLPAVGQHCEQENGGYKGGAEGGTEGTPTCSRAQKMCASSCWKRLTRVSPVREPGGSLRCSTPKSARRSGSSRHDRGRWANMRLPADGWMDGWMGVSPAEPPSLPQQRAQLTSGPGSSWV